MKAIVNKKGWKAVLAATLCGTALVLAACGIAPVPGTGQVAIPTTVAPTAGASTTAPAVAGSYQATGPAADASSLTRRLELATDGAARLTTTYEGKAGSFVEQGTWSASGATVKVALTDNNGRAEQNSITFELRGGTLVATTYNQTLYGASGLQLVRVEAGAGAAAGSGVSETALLNGQYRLPDIGSLRLTDGQFSYAYGSGATQVNKVGYLTSALGDLNGDGKPDAAVILWANTGGSGTFVYILAVVDQGGQPTQVAAELLGDRIQMGPLAVKDGQIVASVKAFAAGDPQCCPSQQVTRTYQLDGTALKVVSEVKPAVPTATRVPTAQPTATVVPTAAPAAMTEAGLRNASFQLPDVGVFQLKDGSFEKKYGDGATQVYRVTFVQAAAGDLNGDKLADGAAVLSLSSGGTGQFRYLVVTLAGTQPRQLAALALGDRSVINGVAIQNSQVTVDMVVSGPNDPLCCPSQAVKRVYRLQGDTLVELK
jgi:hypothetical protein